MSYKMSHNNRNYWVKESSQGTQVHLLEKKGCSEKIVVTDENLTEEQVVKLLDK